MISRVCVAVLLLIGLCSLAAAAQGGPVAAPAAPPAADFAATQPAPVLCLGAAGEPSLAAPNGGALTSPLTTAPGVFEPSLRQFATCSSCTGTRCTSLHSCVLMHCC